MRALHSASLNPQVGLSRERYTMAPQHSSGGWVVASKILLAEHVQRHSATLRRGPHGGACTPQGGLPPYMSGWGWECDGVVYSKWLVEKSRIGRHLESAVPGRV